MAYEERDTRVTIKLDGDVYDDLQKMVPWGMRSDILNALLKDALHVMKKGDKNMIMGAILSGDMTMKDYLNKYEGDNDG